MSREAGSCPSYADNFNTPECFWRGVLLPCGVLRRAFFCLFVWLLRCLVFRKERGGGLREKEREGGREKERDRDRETERQRQTDRDRQTDRQTEKERLRDQRDREGD